MEIRPCTEQDLEAVCRIYNAYVETTVITFEETPVSVPEMSTRLAAYTAHFPWLVCVVEGEVLGYAYASRWKERSAYRQTAEVTIYLHPDSGGRGYGKALYTALLPRLQQLGYHVALACIALPNEASVGLHESFGFKKVAHFAEVGRKFERWLDVGYWQVTIGNQP